MISYQDYLNLLNDKNILLYDFQKRISYARLQNLHNQSSEYIYNKIGGGYDNNNIDIFNKLTSLDKHNLEKVITLLNYKKFDMAKILLERFS